MAADKRYHNVANRRDCRSKNCNYQRIKPLGSTQLTTLQPQFIKLKGKPAKLGVGAPSSLPIAPVTALLS
jgi:hypothetical protein